MADKLPKVNGKEAIGFWWRATYFAPFIVCVPIFSETKKSVEVEDIFSTGLIRQPKSGPTCSYFHLKKDAVEFIKAHLEDRAADAHKLAQYADEKLRRFVEWEKVNVRSE